MNKTTEPLKNKDTIKAIELYLKNNNFRNYGLFKVQLNTGLRISDIVKLKYNDIFNENGQIKTHLNIIEQKTNKKRVILINNTLKIVFNELKDNLSIKPQEYIFKSRKGKNNAITTTQVHRIYQNIAKIFNLKNFNSHSLRKTFCYFIYKKNKDINLIMKLMNHSNSNITLRYIGLTDNDIDNIYNELDF